MAAHGNYDGFLRPYRPSVPYMPAIHNCPWCESCLRGIRGPPSWNPFGVLPPADLAQGPLMQHGSCSDACNHLWVRERVYLQRHVNDRFDHDINQLTNLHRTFTQVNSNLIANLENSVQNIADRMTGVDRVGRAFDIIGDLIERVQDLEARTDRLAARRSRSPRRNEQ